MRARPPWVPAPFAMALLLVGAVATVRLRADSLTVGRDAFDPMRRLASISIHSMAFQDTPIRDVLVALADSAGISLVPDDTVTGNVSYTFHAADLASALTGFLNAYGFQFWFERSVFRVSRVRIELDAGTGLLSLSADDVPSRELVQAVSRKIGKSIFAPGLGSQTLSIHESALSPQKLLEVIAAGASPGGSAAFRVTDHGSYFTVSRPSPQTQNGQSSGGQDSNIRVKIGDTADKYSISENGGTLRSVITALFAKAHNEFVWLLESDPLVPAISYTDRSFENLLKLVLQNADAEFVRHDGVYYLYSVDRRDLLDDLRNARRIPLKYISGAELQAMIPSPLATRGGFRVVEPSDSVVVYGTDVQRSAVESFLAAVDQPPDGRRLYRYSLSTIRPADFARFLPPEWSDVRPVEVPDSDSVTVLVRPERKKEFDAFVSRLDSGDDGFPVELSHIGAKELIQHLPPSVEAKDIVQTADPRLVFFRGSSKRLAVFERELKYIDRGTPQITYHLLIVQHQQSDSLDTALDLDNTVAGPGRGNVILGNLGPLLSLKFDVLSVLGYRFGVSLSAGLSANRARVLADTSIRGLSGEKVRFESTNTYRYRDTRVDASSGQVQTTGVVREITSGLVVSITGGVSGDDAITMSVDASISKQGADVSSSGDDPPPTSARTIHTTVRTSSGRPVSIGGLVQDEVTLSVKKIPILGNIPVIGSLFSHRVSKTETTEITLYLLPSIDSDGPAQPTDQDLIARYYPIVEQAFHE